MIIHNPILTGSFTVNGTDVASITSSAASITAINAYTASQNILNGTYTLTSSFAAQTASFTAFTSSVNTFTASQLVLNGTYATTGSNTFAGIQTVNSNLVVTGSITAQTLIVQTITSSVDFVTGSTRFGSISANTHVFTGSMSVSGSGTFYGTLETFKRAYVSGLSTNAAYTTYTSIGASTGYFGVDNSTGNEFAASGGSAYALNIWGVNTYPMIFGTNNTEKMRLDASGNLGLGVTASAWYTGYTALQVGESAALFSNRTSADTRTTQLANNAYLNSGATNWIYAQTDEATRYEQVNGEHNFYSVVSGSAGGNITWGTSKMTITSTGNVGIGTSSPTNGSSFNKFLHIDGGSVNSALCLSGLNVAGQATIGYDSGNLYIEALGNATGTNNNILFSTTSTNSSFTRIERMRITSGGELFFGCTTQPGAGNATTGAAFGPSGYIIAQRNSATAAFLGRGTNDGVILSFYKDTTPVGSISTNANSLPSDLNFKKNINNLDLGLNLITKLRPVTYNHKIDDDGAALSTGFIAQELEQSLKELGIEENKYYILQYTPNENETHSQYWLDYTKMIPILTKAIQEQQAQITELKNK